MKQPLALSRAMVVADGLVARFAPYCERLAVAGSLRRQESTVGDLELVAIPRWEERPDPDAVPTLFGPAASVQVNLLAEAVRRHEDIDQLKPGATDRVPWKIRDDGRYWRLAHRPTGLQVDMFVVSPERWGLIYFLRTGPWDYSQWALSRWKFVTGGGFSEDGELRLPNGQIRPTPEEADVFAALEISPVGPTDRRVDWQRPAGQ